jgi:hypothetical protein
MDIVYSHKKFNLDSVIPAQAGIQVYLAVFEAPDKPGFPPAQE